jgi:hypothetical protein
MTIATMFAACGGSAGTSDVTMVSMLNPAKYVADSLTVPMDRMQFGLDLNGDGKVDNQLGNIIGALTANNLDTQGGVDTAICEGAVVLLVTETSADATYQNDDASGVQVGAGDTWAYPSPAPAACAAGTGGPKYDGTDTFVAKGAAAQFAGRISNGLYSSNSPVTTKSPVSVALQLPLVAGADPVNLQIIGAHIQFHYANKKLTGGQINGAIKESDVNGTIIPNVATLLNNRVVANPTGSTEMQILQIFDIGCADASAKNIDGTPAAKGDNKIAICEVSDNSIIKNVLNPDVQMFDSAGNYHPSAANTTKDSLSLGLGFSAVQASY